VGLLWATLASEVWIQPIPGGVTRALKRTLVPSGQPEGTVAQLVSGYPSSNKIPMVGLSMLMASSGQTLERKDKPDDHMRIRPSVAHTVGVLRLVSVATAMSHDVDHVVLVSHTRTVVLTPVIYSGKGAAALSHTERRQTLLESVRSTDVTITPPKHRWRVVVIAPGGGGGATRALCNTDGPDEGDTLS
jgi:hypothetical protein